MKATLAFVLTILLARGISTSAQNCPNSGLECDDPVAVGDCDGDGICDADDTFPKIFSGFDADGKFHPVLLINLKRQPVACDGNSVTVNVNGTLFINESTPLDILGEGIITINGSVQVESEPTEAAVHEILRCVRRITGDFDYSSDTTKIKTLNLEALETIDGDLDIDNNDNLQQVIMPALRSVGGKVDIESNDKLTLINMPELVTIGRDTNTAIAYNGELVTLNLPKLTTVDGTFTVDGNDKLPTLELPMLQSAGYSSSSYRFSIRYNDLLTTISLPMLTRTESYLYISDNDALVSISAPNLVQGGRYWNGLYIQRNDKLTAVDLPALNQSEYSGATYITHNERLQSVSLNSITRSNSLQITDNDILTSISVPSYSAGSFSFDRNPLLETYSLPSLESMSSLSIQGNLALRTIEISSVTSVSGSFIIDSNPLLENVNCPALTHIQGNLQVSGHNVLTTVNLPALSTVIGFFEINNNPMLSPPSVRNLTSVGQRFSSSSASDLYDIATDYPNLGTINGISVDGHTIFITDVILESLTTGTVQDPIPVQVFDPAQIGDGATDLGGITFFTGNVITRYMLNAELNSVIGNATHVGGNLELEYTQDNVTLNTINEVADKLEIYRTEAKTIQMNGLLDSGDELEIRYNEYLTHVYMQVFTRANTIDIEYNDELEYWPGFEDQLDNSVNTIYIRNNPMIHQVMATSITYLNSLTIEGNFDGRNDFNHGQPGGTIEFTGLTRVGNTARIQNNMAVYIEFQVMTVANYFYITGNSGISDDPTIVLNSGLNVYWGMTICPDVNVPSDACTGNCNQGSCAL